MISFYPGPSRVHDEIPSWIKTAHKKGILSMNHRSAEFMTICENTVTLLKKKLSIPESYSVFFASSATECWEILAQSLIETKSIHIHNGAFGEKWFDYTLRLHPGSESVSFPVEESLNPADLVYKSGEMICITQNETSNGTEVSNNLIADIRKNNSGHLIAVDVTSSMAGIELDFLNADVWFASVQKCFGLPAGLAVMVCSPEAIKRMNTIGEKSHYNSLLFTKEMMDKWQTPYTPNVLGIYLLECALNKFDKIAKTSRMLSKRQKNWVAFFRKSKSLSLFVKNSDVRSKTVITVKGAPEAVTFVKEAAKKKGLLLGEGYGNLKSTTFRIANFPALKDKEIEKLMKFLKTYR